MFKNISNKWSSPETVPPEELMADAFHEAGQAVARELSGEGIISAELYKEGKRLDISDAGVRLVNTFGGHAKVKRRKALPDPQREFFAIYAGSFAEESFTRKRRWFPYDRNAMCLFGLRSGMTENEVAVLIQKTWERLRSWWGNSKVKECVVEVGLQLTDEGRISGQDVEDIVNKGSRNEMLRSIDRSILEPSVQ